MSNPTHEVLISTASGANSTPRKKLLIATANPGKLHEIKEMLEGLDYDIQGIADLGLRNDYVEEGDTHEEIAMKKARYFFDQCGIMTMADDSGIIVDALKSELGVKTRRWGAGEKVSDVEWLAYFMKAMEHVPEKQRTAHFVCCCCVIDAEGQAHLFKGQTDGIISREVEAPIKHGLPLSSVFRPNGYDEVYSALEVAEKNEVSHRGKAVKKVREWMKEGL